MRVSELKPRILLGPGPSHVPGRVRRAMARPTIGHLDPQFLALMDDVARLLRLVFGTANRVTFPVSGTGSAGMEAALANLLEPGETAIVGVAGVFGERLVEMARRMGAQVVRVEAEWGRIVEPDALLGALRRNAGARLLAVVHAETSTGVRQPLEELGAALRGTETLFVVDAVTSLGGIPVEVDRMGIDVCYSGTQKCLSAPPGLAPITFSERALERVRRRRVPVQSWYLDVSLIERYWGAERVYHHTAPINMMYALHEALLMVEEEGLENRYRRHHTTGMGLQRALQERGFGLLAAEGYRLPQLTAAVLPEGYDEAALRSALLVEHGIEIGGGLGALKGKLWRIGLMGASCTQANVRRFLNAVDELLVGGAP